MNNSITYLGKVINVNSTRVEVEISSEIPSAAPIINGKVYKIGQIGTFVKFPIGNLTLFGIVSSVSNTPTVDDEPEEEYPRPDYGKKFLQVQLVGEQIGNTEFKKGVGTYPTINDEGHLVTENDLKFIYGDQKDGTIEIGKHASSNTLPVNINIHDLVLRHSAILGSTGSGKSNTNAYLIKKILNDYPGSRIVLIDIHGEYEAAFKDQAKVFKINSSDNPLHIPFWTMNFDELAFFLVGRPEGQERPADKRLREEILRKKRENSEKLKAGGIDEKFVTVDSPIPFNLRELWYKFNRELNATYNETEQIAENEALIEEGDPEELKPAKFEPYSIGGGAPFKSKEQTMFDYERKILSRLKDDRYDFMFNPGPYKDVDSKYDIDKLLRDWIDNDKRLTILDLSGVPFEFVDISVGLITRFIFDSMYWGRSEEYTGRNRPLLMVYEEAHNYLPSQDFNTNSFGYAKKAVEKIFKEGRKFGIGSMVITQRPSEISKTILAQVGTFIALRLTNSRDKSTVQASAPNNMSSLIELLSSLRVGEAIVVGESIKIPSRVRIKLVEPRPSSNDPKLVENWNKTYQASDNDYQSVVTKIRIQKDDINTEEDKDEQNTS
ncbi:DUF853 family protein [Aliifodinibius sp. S!AR15-10]|uniref:ATP-binding protein n=1 Tax=Aliifodinibius sp. S!AR15-10 TaxID=2950437 RepID=UPI0028580850|nr:helicase HerA-like domain-containing protein [Aliifodinibius sp. S!AR15-10]MDR8389505.1 DUF853 family protein [Aliifodinibius sp. S!AR15-10]